MASAIARHTPGSPKPVQPYASASWAAVPSSVTRSSTRACPLPSKTPPSAMKHAISSRYGPTQRRNSTPSWATSGPAPKAAMIQRAVT